MRKLFHHSSLTENLDNENNKKLAILAFIGSIALQIFILNLIIFPSNGTRPFPGDPLGSDFITYWGASILVDNGETDQIFDLHKFHEAQTRFLGKEYTNRLWHYPPFYLFYLIPLSWLPYLPAYIGWNLATFALYLFATIQGRFKFYASMALLFAPSTLVNGLTGQNGFLSAALFANGILLLNKRPYLSGVLFGLLAYKPQLGILIPFILIATRQWKPFISAVTTIASLLALSLLIHGSEIWSLYLTNNIKTSFSLLEKGSGLLLFMMPTVFVSGRLLGLENGLNYFLQIIVAFGVIVGIMWGMRRTHDSTLQLILASVGTFLVAPFAFNYDMTILSLAITFYFIQSWEHNFNILDRMLFMTIWFLPLVTVPLSMWGLPIAPLILGLFLYRLLSRLRQTKPLASQ